jgi:DNA-binding HxlR family transcriptional regulator
MSARNYGEYCGLAHALELVGERWGLLVIRELLVGPKRFTDLANGLHRIPSNVLSARLKELEQHGVVERRVLPRPSGAVVYALTDYGEELDGVLVKLAGWGARSAGEPREGDAVSPTALVLGLRGIFRPDAAGDLQATYELRIGDLVAHARIAGGELEVAEGPAANPDLTIEADTSLRRVLTGGHSDTISLHGDRALFDRFAEIFRIEQVPGTPVSEGA